MAYFYVKNSLGTCVTTAGALSKQTGAFGSGSLVAANVYETIMSAIDNGGATSGDYVCVSDSHAWSGSAVTNYNGPTSGDYLYVVSVSDTACDTEVKASVAQESVTGGSSDINPKNRINLRGLYLKSDDNFQWGYGYVVIAEECTIEVTGTADRLFSFPTDGSGLQARNCDFIGPSGASGFFTGGSTLSLFGGSISGGVTSIAEGGSFYNGGGTINLVGVDMSSMSGVLFSGVGDEGSSEDLISITAQGCAMHASATWFDSTIAGTDVRVTAAACGTTSASAEYQYYAQAYAGSVEDESGIYRDGSTAFPAGAKTSLKCATLSTATPAAPFWFDFPTRYAELSNTASDTLRIYLQSNTQLYDSDVWPEVTYADGTSPEIRNFISARHTNILDTNGTELTTNTETWSGTAQTYQYQIDIDTSTDAGSDCVPTTRMYVAKSATIYFCTSVDQV